MMKAEQKQMVWMEFYLAVVKCCKEDCSAHCDAFAVERRNHLGSVTRTYNSSGTAVFSAEYDPWGVQRQLANSIRYHRGYCGHEMLNDLQAINMRSATLGDPFVTTWRKNGRLYDPYIARFLSPDNYVQLPTSAQSFNRYSYCLNNPLKHTDPSGEFWTSKHMTHWFEISANRKANRYFSKRKQEVEWDYERFPLNIDKILYYYKEKN